MMLIYFKIMHNSCALLPSTCHASSRRNCQLAFSSVRQRTHTHHRMVIHTQRTVTRTVAHTQVSAPPAVGWLHAWLAERRAAQLRCPRAHIKGASGRDWTHDTTRRWPVPYQLCHISLYVYVCIVCMSMYLTQWYIYLQIWQSVRATVGSVGHIPTYVIM